MSSRVDGSCSPGDIQFVDCHAEIRPKSHLLWRRPWRRRYSLHQSVRGAVDPRGWQSYVKLQRELRQLARRQDQRAQQAKRVKWKKNAMRSRKINQGDEQ